jgi:hypothetical protein
VRITGARIPSGEPIIEQEQAERPPRTRSGGGGAGGYRGQGRKRFAPRRPRTER